MLDTSSAFSFDLFSNCDNNKNFNYSSLFDSLNSLNCLNNNEFDLYSSLQSLSPEAPSFSSVSSNCSYSSHSELSSTLDSIIFSPDLKSISDINNLLPLNPDDSPSMFPMDDNSTLPVHEFTELYPFETAENRTTNFPLQSTHYQTHNFPSQQMQQATQFTPSFAQFQNQYTFQQPPYLNQMTEPVFDYTIQSDSALMQLQDPMHSYHMFGSGGHGHRRALSHNELNFTSPSSSPHYLSRISSPAALSTASSVQHIEPTMPFELDNSTVLSEIKPEPKISSPYASPSLRATKMKKEATLNPFKCHMCGEVFQVITSLRQHVNTVHSDITARELARCTQKRSSDDDEDVKSGEKRRRGSSSKRKDFKCQTCSKSFSRKQDLKRHVVTHIDGFKPYVCDICQMKFTRSDALSRHVKSQRCMKI
ncbi:hypothetical protein HK098_007160 [Nowakowskiella sp. JEL0407]|nr:hypothetical protein HK098_007160 [Nowakowskiella sp. JEL0407]